MRTTDKISRNFNSTFMQSTTRCLERIQIVNINKTQPIWSNHALVHFKVFSLEPDASISATFQNSFQGLFLESLSVAMLDFCLFKFNPKFHIPSCFTVMIILVLRKSRSCKKPFCIVRKLVDMSDEMCCLPPPQRGEKKNSCTIQTHSM